MGIGCGCGGGTCDCGCGTACFSYSNDLSGGTDDWTTSGSFIFAPASPAAPVRDASVTVDVQFASPTDVATVVVAKDDNNYYVLRIGNGQSILSRSVDGTEYIVCQADCDVWESGVWHTIKVCTGLIFPVGELGPLPTVHVTKDGVALLNGSGEDQAPAYPYSFGGIQIASGISYRNFLFKQQRAADDTDSCPACVYGFMSLGCDPLLHPGNVPLIVDLANATGPQGDFPDCATELALKYELHFVAAFPLGLDCVNIYVTCKTLSCGRSLYIFAYRYLYESPFTTTVIFNFPWILGVGGDRCGWRVHVAVDDPSRPYRYATQTCVDLCSDSTITEWDGLGIDHLGFGDAGTVDLSTTATPDVAFANDCGSGESGDCFLVLFQNCCSGENVLLILTTSPTLGSAHYINHGTIQDCYFVVSSTQVECATGALVFADIATGYLSCVACSDANAVYTVCKDCCGSCPRIPSPLFFQAVLPKYVCSPPVSPEPPPVPFLFMFPPLVSGDYCNQNALDDGFGNDFVEIDVGDTNYNYFIHASWEMVGCELGNGQLFVTWIVQIRSKDYIQTRGSFKQLYSVEIEGGRCMGPMTLTAGGDAVPISDPNPGDGTCLDVFFPNTIQWL